MTYSGPAGKGTSSKSARHDISFASLYGSWSGGLPTEQFTITIGHAAVVKCQ